MNSQEFPQLATKNVLVTKRRELTWTLTAIFLIFLSANTVSAQSGKKLYRTFFAGDEGTQYFIKPLVFRGEPKNRVELDLTFRHKNEIKGSATVNFSFSGNELMKEVDSLKISNDEVDIYIKEITRLFSQRDKKAFESRFSSQTTLSDLEQLFNNNHWTLTLYKAKEIIQLSSPKKTKKKIAALDSEIFSLW